MSDPAETMQSGSGLRPVVFYVIVVLVFVADQLSKSWIQKAMEPDRPRPIVRQWFLLNLTYNTGGAWGLAPRDNGLFIAFAAVAVFALLYAYHRMAHVDVLVGGAFALALGGALGNLTDRLRYGHVVDFFDARIINWPIFNIADSAITLGIGLLVIHFLTSGRAETESNGTAAPAVGGVPELAAPAAASASRSLATEEGAGGPTE